MYIYIYIHIYIYIAGGDRCGKAELWLRPIPLLTLWVSGGLTPA